MLPFTREAFLHVFATHNATIWPAQIVAYALAAIVLLAVLRPRSERDRSAALTVAAMWLFTGVVYHWLHFSAINPAATLFAAAFVGQATLLAVAGWHRRLQLGRELATLPGALGLAMLAYPLVVYPALGLLLHGYPEVPLFGVTPCPVTIFTLGVLVLARSAPWWVFPIPLLWSAVGRQCRGLAPRPAGLGPRRGRATRRGRAGS